MHGFTRRTIKEKKKKKKKKKKKREKTRPPLPSERALENFSIFIFIKNRILHTRIEKERKKHTSRVTRHSLDRARKVLAVASPQRQ